MLVPGDEMLHRGSRLTDPPDSTFTRFPVRLPSRSVTMKSLGKEGMWAANDAG